MYNKEAFSIALHSSVLAVLALAPTIVFAHHPIGGAAPETTFQGILSGLSHPIVGLQHFFFIVAVGLLAATHSRRLGYLVASGFVLSTLSGAIVHVLGFDFSFVEPLIIISLMVAGLILALSYALRESLFLFLVTLFGLAHGHAYSETIVGATLEPIFAYLGGFSLMHLILILGISEAGRLISQRPELSNRVFGFTGCSTLLAGILIGGLNILG